MKIYTSYFANWRNFPIGSKAVGITRFAPTYWKNPNLEVLAPSKELLNQYRSNDIDEYMFKKKYFKELEARGLTPKLVMQELQKLGAETVILCCYEKPGDFCHRHLFAEWMGGIN